MKTELYTIRTLSNLHAGSGDINFDIVDKQVQRNHLGIPNINSSSLKGALREHCGKGQLVDYIFGPPNDGSNPYQTGAYSFFEAQLLSRPVRSNKKPYFSATSPEIIQALLDVMDDFSIELCATVKAALEDLVALSPIEGTPMIFEDLDGVKIEDFSATKNTTFSAAPLEALLGQDIVLFHHDDYKKLTLPVLSRNHLDSGESKNLWYEEVVPRQSRFYFVLGKPTNLDPQDAEDKIAKFTAKFEKSFDDIVQIGANKSIGYGYSRITKASL